MPKRPLPMYKVKNTKAGSQVIEIPTGVTVESFGKKAEAKDFCQKLNDGAGFQGWTPQFICRT